MLSKTMVATRLRHCQRRCVLFKGVCRRSLSRVCIEERSHLKNYHHGGDEFYWKGVITCGSDCPKSDVKCVLEEK